MAVPTEPAVATGDGGLVRLRLDLGYDGTDFSGWARQPGRRTVQETVQDALCAVLRIEAAALSVAGRTDAGVHARGQVAHVDVPAANLVALEGSLRRRLAGVLPSDVVVHGASDVSADFHARFSAEWRRYRYRIADTIADRDPLRRTDTVWWPRPLDVEAMADAAQCLLGEHDFAAFCKRREGASTIRTLRELAVRREEVIVFDIRADAFCHSMVRSMVGALLAVGERRRDTAWLAATLLGSTRPPDVTVAAAHGLSLIEVSYPPAAEYARRAQLTRRYRTDPAQPNSVSP